MSAVVVVAVTVAYLVVGVAVAKFARRREFVVDREDFFAITMVWFVALPLILAAGPRKQ